MVEHLYRTLWRLADVVEVVPETRRTKSLVLDVPAGVIYTTYKRAHADDHGYKITRMLRI